MTQGMSCRWIVGSLLLWIYCAACTFGWAIEPAKGGDTRYEVQTLSSNGLNFESLGLTDCTSKLNLTATRVLAACRYAKRDVKTDYGLRLILIATDSGRTQITSVSAGAADAYKLSLQVRKRDGAKWPFVVLADGAAEFAFGIGVYALIGDEIKYLGDIGFVRMDSDNNAVSALDSTVIDGYTSGIRVSFTQDVYRLTTAGDYERVRACDATVVLDGKSALD